MVYPCAYCSRPLDLKWSSFKFDRDLFPDGEGTKLRVHCIKCNYDKSFSRRHHSTCHTEDVNDIIKEYESWAKSDRPFRFSQKEMNIKTIMSLLNYRKDIIIENNDGADLLILEGAKL